MCVSAYLDAARALDLDDARHFGLRSLDRILAEGWDSERGLRHVIAYSDLSVPRREVPGVLDDYAFATLACLDAYESTADLSYFNFAQKIAAMMIARFFDAVGGGFFDTDNSSAEKLGVLGTRRKPFQDSPTPAGNPAAAIALLRLHAYTNDASCRAKAEQTLEILAGSAGQYGLFAATYGIAAIHFSRPHTQVIVVGDDPVSTELFRTAVAGFEVTKSALSLPSGEVVPQKLPPALAETVPGLPDIKRGNTVAVVCSGFACQPPTADAGELRRMLVGKQR
jgi:uncharacterized protein YyaL (SSP411 family)